MQLLLFSTNQWWVGDETRRAAVPHQPRPLDGLAEVR